MRNVSYVHRIDTPVLAVQREQRLRLSERSHIMYCRQGTAGNFELLLNLQLAAAS